jgi:uncharacterized membrane protein
MIGMALVGLRYGDFASIAQEFPKWFPARVPVEYAAAVLMLLGGIGLLFERSAAIAARALFVYTVLWVVLLNLPIVLKGVLIEGNWQAMGEILPLVAGAWILKGRRGTRGARRVFGFALIPLGLAHFVYLNLTAPLIPAWLPYHTELAYLTGAALIAAGVGILLSIVPRLAAVLAAALLTAFTVLVWIPMIVAKPGAQNLWSEITISWAISAAAWVVAASQQPPAQDHRRDREIDH